MFNGIFKIPMQFFIVFTGVMLFVAYQFNEPPIIFNDSGISEEVLSDRDLQKIESSYQATFIAKKELMLAYHDTKDAETLYEIKHLHEEQENLRKSYKESLKELDAGYNEKDGDYVFLSFVLKYLPHGLIGLLLAVILSAAMSSTAGELNALASTTTVDFYKKYVKKNEDENEVRTSQFITIIWGGVAILVALVAGLFENLIELVNILGSLFYGTILGVFLVAFFLKKIGASATLIAAILAEAIVLGLFIASRFSPSFEIGYLWYNLIGSVAVIVFAFLFEIVIFNDKKIIKNT
jgi:Na+(H+)/acetate symporter ActP